MNRIFKNARALSESLAEYFVSACHEAIEESSRFTVCLTGGSSPKGLYELLASQPYSNAIPWDKCWFFWGDERGVANDHPENNASMAFRYLLDKVPINRKQVFRMNGTLQASESASNYEAKLRAFFAGSEPSFDLILMGMGANAHTLSLFPGTFLTESQNWVEGTFITEVGMNRITLTPRLVNQARRIAFIVFGADKAEAVHAVQQGKKDVQRYPAQSIEAIRGELIWFMDEAAASKLTVS